MDRLLIMMAIMIFGLAFAFRLLLGEKVYEHVKSRFVYDIIKGLIKLPILVTIQLLKLIKNK